MEKIAAIELEMSRTQKNKATAAHLGSLKAKLARRDLIEGSGAKSGPKGEGFDVTKTGDCRVGMVGFRPWSRPPSDGTFEVMAYEFTTLTCIPGVIRYCGAKIQLLDLPGIIEGAKDGKGRGRQPSPPREPATSSSSYSTRSPLTHKRLIEHELEGFGIRLNKEPPKITFKKKEKGGINFTPNNAGETTFLDADTVKQICGEYKIQHADVKLHDDCTDEDLIDVIEGSRVYVPCIYAINKIDQITVEELNLSTR